MLEHVAQGQSRFMTPGVAPDQRGVVLGRLGLLVFPTLDGAVSWFRLYTAESSLDEIYAGLTILRVRTPLKSRAIAVRIAAGSSYSMDRAARCAELVGGTTFTGTSKHFVLYRDRRSPFGYDATDIRPLADGIDFIAHGDGYEQQYTEEAELSFERLLFRLSLRRVPGADRLSDDERGELLLLVERGLADGVIRYLWRNQVDAKVTLVETGEQSSLGGTAASYLVFRVEHMPVRILSLFLDTPGVEVFRPVTANVASQVGFRHVMDLASCASVFDKEKHYFFWGRRDRVDIVDGPLEFSDIEHLASVNIDVNQPKQASELVSRSAEGIGVDLRLSPSLAAPRRIVGTLVPTERLHWLKRLIFALPHTSLRGHRIAVTNRGAVLIASSARVEMIPLGEPLAALSPGLLIPLGTELVPRIAPQALAAALGHGTGVLTVFTRSGQPFQVSEVALVPLERRALAKVSVYQSETIDMRVPEPEEPNVVNDAVGGFALWGFETPPSSKLLPGKDE